MKRGLKLFKQTRLPRVPKLVRINASMKRRVLRNSKQGEEKAGKRGKTAAKREEKKELCKEQTVKR